MFRNIDAYLRNKATAEIIITPQALQDTLQKMKNSLNRIEKKSQPALQQTSYTAVAARVVTQQLGPMGPWRQKTMRKSGKTDERKKSRDSTGRERRGNANHGSGAAAQRRCTVQHKDRKG